MLLNILCGCGEGARELKRLICGYLEINVDDAGDEDGDLVIDLLNHDRCMLIELDDMTPGTIVFHFYPPMLLPPWFE